MKNRGYEFPFFAVRPTQYGLWNSTEYGAKLYLIKQLGRKKAAEYFGCSVTWLKNWMKQNASR